MNNPTFVDRPLELLRSKSNVQPLKTFSEAILERRATPHFRLDPVPSDLLNAVLSLGTQSPSGYNLQPWRFVIVRDPSHRCELKSAALDQEKVAEAPVVLVAYGRPESWREDMDPVLREGARRGAGEASKIDDTKRTITRFLGSISQEVWLNRQVMIAVTTLMWAAEVHGLDTAPMEGFDADAVKKVCRLPSDAVVVALLALGYLEGNDKPYGGRFELETLIHDEIYGTPWGGD